MFSWQFPESSLAKTIFSQPWEVVPSRARPSAGRRGRLQRSCSYALRSHACHTLTCSTNPPPSPQTPACPAFSHLLKGSSGDTTPRLCMWLGGGVMKVAWGRRSWGQGWPGGAPTRKPQPNRLRDCEAPAVILNRKRRANQSMSFFLTAGSHP